LLDAFAAWCDSHLQEARSVGAEITFGRTDDDRKKHSIWIGLEFQGRLGELIVWDSGEAEYLVGREGEPIVNEHHEIKSGDQLVALLDRLLLAVVP